MSKPTKTASLEKISIKGCEYLTDNQYGVPVFHVNSPHSLTQASGYLKYICGKDGQQVFFRGQSKLYPNLSPSLFRGIKAQRAQSDRITALRNACSIIIKSNKLFDRVPFEAQEALLQHYGLRTTWIDLVDNVWVSLWFACYETREAGALKQYLNFERRDPFTDKNPFAYILLIATDMNPSEPFVPGLYRGEETELVDLRVAAPSIFLRPHAQHGVLFRLRGGKARRPMDYISQVRGVIRIALRDAISWIGDGKLTGTHVFFPPAFYDQGYEMLLSTPFEGSRSVGAIQQIGT